MKLTKLKYNPDNPRRISPEQLDRLIKSIESLPKMMELRPIVYDPDTMHILGGNQRLAALRKMGKTEIPNNWVKSAEEMTEKEKREFILRDNVQSGEWDFGVLEENFADLDLDDIGIELPDIGIGEDAEVVDDEYEPPTEIETDIKVGDLFSLRKDGKEMHRLLCGDATKNKDVERLMGGVKADMVFTDPPYGVDYSAKNEFLNKFDNGNRNQRTIIGDTPDVDMEVLWGDAFGLVREYLAPGGSFYITYSGDKLLPLLQTLRKVGLPEKQILVWVKNNHVLGRSTYQYKHEFILYGWKSGAAHSFYSDFDTTIWEISKPQRSELHPTMKPISLIARALNNSSKPQNNIYDPFLGSGSTMVAAHQLGRKCYGMEIEQQYCQIVIDRMKALDPDIEVVKIDG